MTGTVPPVNLGSGDKMSGTTSRSVLWACIAAPAVRLRARKLLAGLRPGVITLVLVACTSADPPPEREEDVVGTIAGGDPEAAVSSLGAPEVPADALVRAREAADAMGGALQGRLFAALDEGGAMLAVEVCSVEAQAISQEFSVADLSVRRVSLLTRNPINDPDSWEEQRLRAMAALHDAGETPGETAEVVSQDGGRMLRLVRPILVAPPCLACHGDVSTIDPPVLELIRSRYPDDRAVGFEAGDLRGAVSVQLRLGPGD